MLNVLRLTVKLTGLVQSAKNVKRLNLLTQKVNAQEHAISERISLSMLKEPLVSLVQVTNIPTLKP